MRKYIAIDLKSFYASVECVARGLDPLDTNLVVADKSRTEKTICLAVSPSLKSYGIPGRARLFETIQEVKKVNANRLIYAKENKFTSKSFSAKELANNPSCELDFIVATPQMSLYMQTSSKIYDIYLKYVSHEDMHVYSVDEVFIDVTDYLNRYKMTAHELAMKMIRDVLAETGITATAGIGTNMYLCKIAMDIVAKKMPADKDGVRIAELDELSYRQQLWNHKPLTDFWRIGKGIATKLEANGMYTMGDVARCSVGGKFDRLNEEVLYKLFGINAELIIDHAWGYEPCTIKMIKDYVPQSNSLSQGQVLSCPYDFEKSKLIVREMTDNLVLDLVSKYVVTDQIVLTVGYDIANDKYKGQTVVDRYGRKIPKSAHGSINLGKFTSSTRIISNAVVELFDRIVDNTLFVRRMYVVANHIKFRTDEAVSNTEEFDIFSSIDEQIQKKQEVERMEQREYNTQKAILELKKRYGKNAVLKGMNFTDGSTAIERNNQVGGHKA